MIPPFLRPWLPLLVTATATAAAGPPAGFAQAPAELVARFDLDGDGRVDEAEYLAYLMRGFHARDRDGNGVLEGEELPPGARALGAAENEARLRRQFRRQDADGNGWLDARELLAPPRG
ncbi:MAG: hypothetical protein KatS3mg128_0280 [Silanimonas sp.]|nr:MAG: hypothetical protein KatS3mg128_0280 [Silanimonas sp.]